MDITQITPNLYVGSYPTRADALQIARAGIQYVVDLRGEPRANGPAEHEEHEKWSGTDVQYAYVPMRDAGVPIPAAQYARAVDLIERVIRGGGKVLVHCAAGQNRSPSVAYAYLRKTGLSPDAAWALVARRRGANRQYVGCVARYLAGIGVPGVETTPSGSPGRCTGPEPSPDGGKTPTAGPGGPSAPKEGSSVGLWVALAAVGIGIVWLGSREKPRKNPGGDQIYHEIRRGIHHLERAVVLIQSDLDYGDEVVSLRRAIKLADNVAAGRETFRDRSED